MLLYNLLTISLAALISALASLIINAYSRFVFLNWNLILPGFIVFFALFNVIYKSQQHSQQFTGLLIAGLSIKLLMAFICIGLCAWLFKPVFLEFAIHFIAHYFLFTFFEIRYLQHLIKNKTNKT